MTTSARRRGSCRLHLAIGLALAAALAAPDPVAAAGRGICVSAPEETAVNARILQTELMVAALACGEQRRYNAFVTIFRAEIAAQSAALRRLFERTDGGRRELNAFVTRLANDAAARSAAGGGYCTAAGMLLTEALATSPRDFARLSRAAGLPRRLAFPRCR